MTEFYCSVETEAKIIDTTVLKSTICAFVLFTMRSNPDAVCFFGTLSAATESFRKATENIKIMIFTRDRKSVV